MHNGQVQRRSAGRGCRAREQKRRPAVRPLERVVIRRACDRVIDVHLQERHRTISVKTVLLSRLTMIFYGRSGRVVQPHIIGIVTGIE